MIVVGHGITLCLAWHTWAGGSCSSNGCGSCLCTHGVGTHRQVVIAVCGSGGDITPCQLCMHWHIVVVVAMVVVVKVLHHAWLGI